MFALLHRPSPVMVDCQRTYIERTAIDCERALRQHAAYGRKLEELGIAVRTLDVNRDHPDCTFIEDVAIVLDEAAILASMGTPSRAGEPAGVAGELQSLREVHPIAPPATIEGGDVLRVGRTLLVGLSRRTNRAGAAALAQIVEPYGYRLVPVPVAGCLHLKTACTALPDGRLLVNADWLDRRALTGFHCLPIPRDEPWGANTLPIGGRVLLSSDHVQTGELVQRLGFEIVPLELSEFAKAEGGVTCLSLVGE